MYIYILLKIRIFILILVTFRFALFAVDKQSEFLVEHNVYFFACVPDLMVLPCIRMYVCKALVLYSFDAENVIRVKHARVPRGKGKGTFLFSFFLFFFSFSAFVSTAR